MIRAYEERRFGGPRHYELFADRILVKGSEAFRSDFEAAIPLAALQPSCSRARVRSSLFAFGLILIVVGGIGIMERLSSGAFGYEDFWSIVVTALVAAGLVVCAATARKVPYVIYLNDLGQPALGLIETDSAEFKAFTDAVSNQITLTRAPGVPRTP